MCARTTKGPPENQLLVCNLDKPFGIAPTILVVLDGPHVCDVTSPRVQQVPQAVVVQLNAAAASSRNRGIELPSTVVVCSSGL